MDNFMDKIAQKLGAQEAIRANAAADAAQIERLEAQVEEYNACIKEMRKLNLRNAENEQKLKELIEAVKEQLNLSLEENSRQIGQLVETGSGRIEQLTEKGNSYLERLAEEGSAQLERLAEEGNARLDRMAEECMARLHETEDDSLDAEEDENAQRMLEEWKAISEENMKRLEDLFRQSDDFVHRENVKVYRNVQAATAEELGKQIQTVLGGQQDLAGKGKGTQAVSILTLIVAIVNLAMLIAHLAGVF